MKGRGPATSSPLRVLLLADTHLGFDLPSRPRVERPRRGPDFFANFERALTPARSGEVDLVVHGGDLLFRSRVRRELVWEAFAPLKAVADTGVPVVLVPGNHERSAIPFPLLGEHPGIYVLRSPRTEVLTIRGLEVAVAGFPCQRQRIRERFTDLVEATGARAVAAPVRLLCLHQTVEGARVGPVGYTFRRGADVVRGRDLPRGFAAVLAGHIHRHQVLTHDLGGRPLAAPVLYPGSIERTSSAERHEAKGYLTLELEGSPSGGRLRGWSFHPLPTRPMMDLELSVASSALPGLESAVRERLRRQPPRAVIRILLSGPGAPAALSHLTPVTLRRLAPREQLVTARPATARAAPPRRPAPEQW